MFKVGELYADLSLRTENFAKGIQQAVVIAQGAAGSLAAAMGPAPQQALKQTAQVAKQTGQQIQQAVGTAPQQAMQQTAQVAQATGTQIKQGIASGLQHAMRGVSSSANAAGTQLQQNLGNKTQNALKGTSQAAQQAGKQMKKSLGEEPQAALKDTRKEAERVTWALRGYIKDTFRVVSGILISQAFYTILRWIRMLINEAFDLKKAFEESALSFRYLLDLTQEQADRFAGRMRYWALETRYSIGQVTDGFRQLLIAGVAVQNVESAMQVVTGAATAFNMELSDMVGLLTFIQASPVINTSALRRLQSAGINIVPILKEQLGLTAEEIKDINKLGIPGQLMFKALLQGFSKYSEAAQDGAKTLRAISSDFGEVLRDTFGILFDVPYTRWRNALQDALMWLAKFREGVMAQGPRFLFDIFDEPIMRNMEMIVASLRALWNAFQRAAGVIRGIFGDSLRFLSTILAQVLPPIAMFAQTISHLMQAAMANLPALRMLAMALGSLIIANVVGVAVQNLVKRLIGLQIVTKIGTAIIWFSRLLLVLASNIWLVIAAIGIILAFLGPLRGALGKAGESIKNAFGQFPSKNELSGVEKGIGDITGGMEQLEEATTAAANAFKPFLAAFDEVYQVPEPPGGGDGSKDWSGFDIPWPDVAIPSIGYDWRELMGTISQDTLNTIDKIRGYFNKFIDYFSGWKGILLAGAALVLKAILAAVSGWVLLLVAIVAGLVILFIKNWDKIKEGIVNAITIAYEAIKDVFSQIWNTVKLWTDQIWGAVTKTFSYFKDFIINAATAVYEFISWVFTNMLNSIVTATEGIRNTIAVGWQTISTFVRTIVTTIKEFVLWNWENIKTGVMSAVNAIREYVVTRFENMRSTVSTTASNIRSTVIDRFTSLRNTVTNLWESIRTSTVSAWSKITTPVKAAVNSIISFINRLIDAWNAVGFRISADALPAWVPDWIKKGLGTFSIQTPQIKRIPYLAEGGIVNQDTLARIGEGGKKEAVIPLSPSALAPFAEALVEALGDRNGNTGQTMLVGTLVADERGLRELNRRMKLIEVREAGRRGDN